jgi:hypothetical protein
LRQQDEPREATSSRSSAPPLDSSPRGWPLLSLLRDRQEADPRFLSKISLECGIDIVCTGAAEVSARGAAAFGSELIFVCDDLVTTLLLDVCLVFIVAPSAERREEGRHPLDAPPLLAFLASLPNSCLEAAPGPPHPGYTPLQRIAAGLSIAVQYALLGLCCGAVGQAATNLLYTSAANASTDVVSAGVVSAVVNASAVPLSGSAVPPVLPVAVVWSQYMAYSAAARYQLVGAIEQLAERSMLARAPPVLTAVSFGVRLVNNLGGAAQFVDWLKDSGLSP